MINKKNKKIKFGVFIGLSLFITTMLVISFVTELKSRSEILLENNIKSEIEKSNKEISEYLYRNIWLLTDLSTNIASSLSKGKEIPDNYFQIFLDSRIFEYANIVNSNGMLKIDDDNIVDVRHRDFYISSFIERTPSISYEEISEIAKGERLIFTVPIFNGEEYYGSIVAIAKTDILMNIFNNGFNNTTGFSYIINKSGRKVFSSKNSDEDFVNFYQYLNYNNINLGEYVEEVMDSINKNSKNVIKIEKKNKIGYIGHSEIYENSNWIIIAYVPEKYFGDNDIIENNKLVFSIIVLMVLGFFAIMYIFISEIEKQKEINNIYSTDVLTGIGNNAKFESDVKKILKKNSDKKYIIAIMDIQKFKYVNYIYGYKHGDELLKSIAEKLILSFYGDESCARITGDKFIVLAKYKMNFHKRFSNMLSEILRGYESNIYRINFNFNLGFYVIENKEEDVSTMIEKANIAWNYSKKDENCDYKYYNDELLEIIIKDEFLEENMKQALEDNEFIVYFQPKVDLRSKEICGAEALVRWISPKLGFMPPEEFIPLFERNRFIVELDFYVLEEMLKYLRHRIDNNKTIFTIAVNQSRETLRSEGYIDRLKKVIDKYNIPTNLLELEVTESVFVLNYKELYKIIEEIQALGIKVAIDDFGIGYSSLNLLKDANIDILKLDKSFLHNSEITEKSKIIISNIVNMAKELNIQVVCEGVEIQEHRDLLIDAGCYTGQGYYYGRPMTIKDFDELIIK